MKYMCFVKILFGHYKREFFYKKYIIQARETYFPRSISKKSFLVKKIHLRQQKSLQDFKKPQSVTNGTQALKKQSSAVASKKTVSYARIGITNLGR